MLGDVMIVAPYDADRYWPVVTRWRAVVLVRDRIRPPEWMLEQVKPVPLSSRVERSLLDWVRRDDGRSILHHASEPGEHRVAAAVIAALRLAEEHPDRALRFLAWIAQAPDDPASLRFLRRYLPGLHVTARLDPDLGVAVPLGRDALGMLAADLLRTTGDPDAADNVLGTLTPSAAVAIARAGLRIAKGDHPGVHAFAQDRPVDDDLGVALRLMDTRARVSEGDAAAALGELDVMLQGRHVAYPVDRFGRTVRAEALRASGRDLEARLIDEDFTTAATPEPETPETPPAPQAPLFGRNLSDALDDAWARVRRQPYPGAVPPLEDRAEIDALCDEAVVLIRATHFETAEAALLAAMDRTDAWVDEGGSVVDDFYILLAGLFAEQGLTTEEVATLERLRAAHGRAGSTLPAEVSERLVEARASLDDLARTGAPRPASP